MIDPSRRRLRSQTQQTITASGSAGLPGHGMAWNKVEQGGTNSTQKCTLIASNGMV